MATCEDIINDVVGSTNSKVASPVVLRWLSNRYKELIVRTRPARTIKRTDIKAKKYYATGTVAVVVGGTTVTVTGGAWNTYITETAVLDDYVIKLEGVWYPVTSINYTVAPYTLVLTTAYVGTANITAGAYVLARRFYTLPSDFWQSVSASMPDTDGAALDIVSSTELDIIDPTRSTVGGSIEKIAHSGFSATGIPKIEVYPPPTYDTEFSINYFSFPSELTMTTSIVPDAARYVLKEGVMIDLYRYEKANAVREGKDFNAVNMLRLIERDQMGIWEMKIADFIKMNKNSDIDSFMLLDFSETIPVENASGRRSMEE